MLGCGFSPGCLNTGIPAFELVQILYGLAGHGLPGRHPVCCYSACYRRPLHLLVRWRVEKLCRCDNGKRAVEVESFPGQGCLHEELAFHRINCLPLVSLIIDQSPKAIAQSCV